MHVFQVSAMYRGRQLRHEQSHDWTPIQLRPRLWGTLPRHRSGKDFVVFNTALYQRNMSTDRKTDWRMDGRTDGRTDRRMDGRAVTWTKEKRDGNNQTYRRTKRHIDKVMDLRTDRWTDGRRLDSAWPAGWQTIRQTDRQIFKQAGSW
jgi:hypothetical protein